MNCLATGKIALQVSERLMTKEEAVSGCKITHANCSVKCQATCQRLLVVTATHQQPDDLQLSLTIVNIHLPMLSTKHEVNKHS